MNFFKHKTTISNEIYKKLKECGGCAAMPSLRSATIEFRLSSTGKGIETDKLPNYVLEWNHFDEIVKKANSLGGIMYRGDNVVQQSGSKLG